LKPDAEGEKKRLREDGISVVTWDKLLEDAERFHREYLDIVKARAPEDDPRIRDLPAVEDETLTDVRPTAPQ